MCILRVGEKMKTYAVINQKGGVGKSTTSLAIGAGLRLQGFKVLFVDLDAQGNLTYTLGGNVRGYNALGVLERPETATAEVQETPQGDLIASSPALANADTIITQTGKEYRLKEALTALAGNYDICIIDTPPALGILTVNALTACNSAIIPAQADIYSLQGISQLNTTIETVKKYCNPSLSIMGIVLTRFNGRTIIRQEISELLEETAAQLNTRLFPTRIRECTALIEAQARRQSIFIYAPKSNAAIDYTALVNEIIKRMGEV